MADKATKLTHTGAQIDAAIDAVANKANINSPAFTGIPTAPNPTVDNDSTQIATTSFVTTAVGQKQDHLISGVNIKTIDGNSILGSGNISHANSGVTAGTYRSVTVNATGHVIAGTNPTTIADYGITDAKIVNGTITLGSNSITPLTSHQSLAGYLPLSGGTMTGNITMGKNAIVFNQSNDNSWNVEANSGIKILNSITTSVPEGSFASNAIGLSVMGYYGFQIGIRGSEAYPYLAYRQTYSSGSGSKWRYLVPMNAVENYDLNELRTYGGMYRLYDAPTNAFPNAAHGNTLVVGTGSDTCFQLGAPFSTNELYFRTGTWYSDGTGTIRTQSWRQVAFTDSNVASATKINTSTSYSVFGQTYWDNGVPQTVANNAIGQMKYMLFRNNANTDNAGYVGVGSTGNDNIGLIAYSGNNLLLGGNGGSMISLDGTGAHYTKHLFLDGANASSSTANTTQIVFRSSSTEQIAISSNTNALIVNPTTTATTGQIVLGVNGMSTRFTSSGNFGIGVDIPSQKLHVGGNILATGTITQGSDERFKTNIKPLEVRGDLRPVSFIMDGKQGIGFIAQEVQKLYPELVMEDNSEEKYLSLNYSQLTAVLYAEILKLKKEINELKNN